MIIIDIHNIELHVVYGAYLIKFPYHMISQFQTEEVT